MPGHWVQRTTKARERPGLEFQKQTVAIRRLLPETPDGRPGGFVSKLLEDTRSPATCLGFQPPELRPLSPWGPCGFPPHWAQGFGDWGPARGPLGLAEVLVVGVVVTEAGWLRDALGREKGQPKDVQLPKRQPPPRLSDSDQPISTNLGGQGLPSGPKEAEVTRPRQSLFLPRLKAALEPEKPPPVPHQPRASEKRMHHLSWTVLEGWIPRRQEFMV
ncbi:uncharacterized protein LOC121017737 isoform X2 [Herpailurus yagouaroundi]|uniref:uncharacterized protein LOC121017737 isoform X2 n=1 Tax=Herpailurus yagouaroundi TaxID=1608482 RepID=UPI001AD609E5|nr:uncharacterized protein LOC121017737 isoform X2 [Puma yagouaroundi]